MITRAWLVCCLLWFVLIVLLTDWHNINHHGIQNTLAIALIPLIAGVALKLIGRYIVFGTIERRF